MNQNPNSDQKLMVSFKNIIALSFIFLFFVSSSSSCSLSVQVQAGAIKTVHRRQLTNSVEDDDGDGGAPIRYGQFYDKNGKPFVSPPHSAMKRSSPSMLSSSSRPISKRRNDYDYYYYNYKIEKSKKTKMKMKIKNSTPRPNFSVMLPKGFVPPSGSSPCHNQSPNSVVFFCGALKP